MEEILLMDAFCIAYWAAMGWAIGKWTMQRILG
jgi:hypothetical protein